ncbi:tRNA (cytidine(34)-2'-O)-methyltransferase [Pelagibacteraceae bacterium]|nr:tRNA (cytidine(34)-2'-O)-methyltransferase [Pelagibacteraceae bacterium]
MINIALYQPDIPQNTAAIMRLGACLNIKIHIIEPCGFKLDDSRFKRVLMDYNKILQVYRYEDFEMFEKKNKKSRIVLMTTKAKKLYHKFKFKSEDMLLFGRESSGVPDAIQKKVENKLKIPMKNRARSLNVAMSAAIIGAEAIKQTNNFNE